VGKAGERLIYSEGREGDDLSLLSVLRIQKSCRNN
jgi:hypothetical protein